MILYLLFKPRRNQRKDYCIRVLQNKDYKMSKIYHVVYNEIRGTFQKLEDGEDDSFWFTTIDYLRLYLNVLDANAIYLEDKEEQTKLVLKELHKRGLHI